MRDFYGEEQEPEPDPEKVIEEAKYKNEKEIKQQLIYLNDALASSKPK